MTRKQFLTLAGAIASVPLIKFDSNAVSQKLKPDFGDTDMPTFLKYEGHFLEVNNTRLFYRTYGKGKKNLICLAGGPGGAYSGTEEIWTRFGDIATTYLLDLRGTGYSDSITDFRKSSRVQDILDIEAFRSALGLEKMILFGHSYGSGLALRYAVAHEDVMDRLILCGSSGLTDGLEKKANRDFDNRPKKLSQYLEEREEELMGRYPVIKTLIDNFLESKSPDDRNQYLQDLVTNPQYKGFVGEFMTCTEYRNSKPDQRAFIERMGVHPLSKNLNFEVLLSHAVNKIKGGNLKKRLKNFEIPTLIIGGIHMGDGMEATGSKDMGTHIPHSEVAIFEKSGHFPMEDEPEIFCNLMRTFIQG